MKCVHRIHPDTCLFCRADWVAGEPMRKREARRLSRDEQIKEDITAILGKLIGEKAIDQARQAAQL